METRTRSPDLGGRPAGTAGGDAPDSPQVLAGLRMLDLTDDRGAVCGKIFADLGADVIKVEAPAGCPTRRIPPYLDDVPGPDRSLYFAAYQAGKRSVTADLTRADGRAVLEDLVARADFLVESHPTGTLEGLGLGYDRLAAINPRLIYTSITPFGDAGPGAGWKAADIVSWAAGGMMFLMGEPGRPPLQISLPQAHLHAGGEASVSSLLAHVARQRDGRGQHVVVNTQACVVWTLMNAQAFPLLHGNYLRRSGVFSGAEERARQVVFRCADGHVAIVISGGSVYGPSVTHLVEWMDEEGAAPEWLGTIEWASWTPANFMGDDAERYQGQVNDVETLVQAFLEKKTRQELYQGALDRRILLAPVATVSDIAHDPQLAYRGYFQTVPDAIDGRPLVLPGPFAKYTATPIPPPRRAPRLGEHNLEVYGDLLGYDRVTLSRLYSTGAI